MRTRYWMGLCVFAAFITVAFLLSGQEGPKQDVGETVAKPRKKGATDSETDLPKIPSKLNKNKADLPEGTYTAHVTIEQPGSDPSTGTATYINRSRAITLTLSDLPGAGGFTLEVNPPAVATPLKLVCNASGIELSNSSASVKLTPASVSVNNGALEVI